MITHSRKSRRRLHALPATIALLLLGTLWLFSPDSSALPESLESIFNCEGGQLP